MTVDYSNLQHLITGGVDYTIAYDHGCETATPADCPESAIILAAQPAPRSSVNSSSPSSSPSHPTPPESVSEPFVALSGPSMTPVHCHCAQPPLVILLPSEIDWRGEMIPITSLGESSLCHLKGAQQIIVPANITMIADRAFDSIETLRSVIFLHTPPRTILVGQDIFYGNPNLHLLEVYTATLPLFETQESSIPRPRYVSQSDVESPIHWCSVLFVATSASSRALGEAIQTLKSIRTRADHLDIIVKSSLNSPR